MKAEPFISQESIRSILEGMLYHSDDEASSLEYLTLVDDFLDKRRVPHAENRRLFALRSIVNELITEQLSLHRHNFGLPRTDREETLEQACEAIQADSRQQSAELMGWSLLYYRYVRVDLNLSPSSISASSHIEERTLRRYQKRSIERLRDLLTNQEAQLRAVNRRLYLQSMLPNSTQPGIIGRSALLREVRKLLIENPPQHLLLTGPAGIGKTTFANLLLLEQLESDDLDNIVWISGAESFTFADYYLRQMLLGENSQQGLREYLVNQRVAIVFDDVASLLKNIDAFQALLLTLTDARLMVIHTTFIPLNPGFKHILLPGLTRNEVFSIVAAARSNWTPDDELADFAEHLWQMSDGNPLVVKLATNRLMNMNLRQPFGITHEFVAHLTEQTLNTLSWESKQALFIAALCPPIELNKLEDFWLQESVTHEHMVELISAGMLQNVGGDRYSLSDWAHRNVQASYNSQQSVSAIMNKLIDELTHHLMEHAEDCWQIAEHILHQSWPKLSITRRLTWVELSAEFGVRHGNYAIWAAILEKQAGYELSPDLRLLYALCLRKLGQQGQAEDLIRSVIEDTGQSGDFVRQGRGSLEFSVLLRQQGLYDQAQSAARSALAVFKRFGAAKLARETELELAQIAFDAGDFADAKAILTNSARDEVRSLALLGEIHLTLGETSKARQCIKEAIALCQPKSAALGRLYAQMGRVCFQEKDWAASERCFLEAVVLLETHTDWFALARVKTNLAAGLMSNNRDYQDARNLLSHAYDIQLAIRDRFGLMITQHNLAELNRHEAFDERQDQHTIPED